MEHRKVMHLVYEAKKIEDREIETFFSGLHFLIVVDTPKKSVNPLKIDSSN